MTKLARTPKKRTRVLLWLLLPILAVCVWLVSETLHFLNTPASSVQSEVSLVIPSGTPLPVLAQMLESEGLVSSAGRFHWFVRLRRASRQIKAGEYRLSTGLRPGELLDKLVRGQVLLHQVTFPEGYTLTQMANLLDSLNLAKSHRFIAAATDPTFVHKFDIPASSLEGYLFPDTYRFARSLPVETILRTILARFNQHFGPSQQDRARQLGMTRHQVVILASVVEKETAVAAERPLIAGVFLNRLRRRIRLQSDPTVIYGIKDFDGNLTRVHLKTDTPYNTYTRRGLPAGPICNPGGASIQAVLQPASTSYLYFVAKKDGTHHFSSSLVEHNAAVLRHQKRR
ncbi:MAG: endolytic transglycosylase MltG [Deltaproteobacteria bacterium]|nr:MAG: endolytic transglycosylase MltG [Deltaproteobacteria bacterium]